MAIASRFNLCELFKEIIDYIESEIKQEKKNLVAYLKRHFN